MKHPAALLRLPDDARCLYAFAHGAGAGMHHPFMEAVAEGLARRGVATLRYEFPYMERGSRAPDRPPVLVEAVRSAVHEASRRAPLLPLLAGGKSMGGRMTSMAAAEGGLPGVRGIAFFGFPLHAAGRPASARGAHLDHVGLPMLFLQGSRDRLADPSLLEPLVRRLRPEPALHVVEGADHGFHVLRRSGRTDADVIEELCDAFAAWAAGVIRGTKR